MAQLAARLTGATSLFAALRRLHDTGVAHRDVRPANVFMSGNRAGFRSLDAAEPGASELARRLDLVQALATLAVTCGPGGAVAALRAGYGPVDQLAVAAVVQPVALAPWGWRAARAATGSLNEIRHQLLGDNGTVPAAPRLERFRWRTVVTAVALTVAAYLLIGEVSGVNVLGTLGQANPGWLAVAVLGSALTYLGAAIGIVAFVPAAPVHLARLLRPAGHRVRRGGHAARPWATWSSTPATCTARRWTREPSPPRSRCRSW